MAAKHRARSEHSLVRDAQRHLDAVDREIADVARALHSIQRDAAEAQAALDDLRLAAATPPPDTLGTQSRDAALELLALCRDQQHHLEQRAAQLQERRVTAAAILARARELTAADSGGNSNP